LLSLDHGQAPMARWIEVPVAGTASCSDPRQAIGRTYPSVTPFAASTSAQAVSICSAAQGISKASQRPEAIKRAVWSCRRKIFPL